MSATDGTPPADSPDTDTTWLPVPPAVDAPFAQAVDGPVPPGSRADRGPSYGPPADPRQSIQPWQAAPSQAHPTRVAARPLVGPGGPPPAVHTTAPVFVGQQLIVHTPPKKSAGVAYLFLLLLGGLGAHQFYLGKRGRAIFYLLTFFGVFGIMPVVDLFTLPSQVRQVNTQRAVLGR